MQDACAYFVAALHQVTTYARQVNKGLVNGIDFLARTQSSGKAHHAITEIAVQGKVRRQCYQTVRLFHVLDLEPGCTHGDTQCFGFVATGNGAAVVITEHHNRTALQAVPEHPFAGHIEVVSVYQGVHVAPTRAQVGKRLMVAVTTPQTSMVCPSLGTISGNVTFAARSLTRPARWYRRLTVKSPSTTATTI